MTKKNYSSRHNVFEMGYPGNTVNNDSQFVKSLMCNLYVPKGCLFKNKAERSRDTRSCTLKSRFAYQKFITKADSFKHTESWRPKFFSRWSLSCHKMFCFSQWTLRLDCRDSLKVCWADEHHSEYLHDSDQWPAYYLHIFSDCYVVFWRK